jgi:hypothetical protein
MAAACLEAESCPDPSAHRYLVSRAWPAKLVLTVIERCAFARPSASRPKPRAVRRCRLTLPTHNPQSERPASMVSKLNRFRKGLNVSGIGMSRHIPICWYPTLIPGVTVQRDSQDGLKSRWGNHYRFSGFDTGSQLLPRSRPCSHGKEQAPPSDS